MFCSRLLMGNYTMFYNFYNIKGIQESILSISVKHTLAKMHRFLFFIMYV